MADEATFSGSIGQSTRVTACSSRVEDKQPIEPHLDQIIEAQCCRGRPQVVAKMVRLAHDEGIVSDGFSVIARQRVDEAEAAAPRIVMHQSMWRLRNGQLTPSHPQRGYRNACSAAWKPTTRSRGSPSEGRSAGRYRVAAQAVVPNLLGVALLTGLGKIVLDIGAYAGREFFRQKTVDHDQRRAGACSDFTHGVCCAEERSCDDLPAPQLDDYIRHRRPVGRRPQADLAEIEHRVFVDGSHEPDIRSGAGVEAEAGVGAGDQAWPRVLDRVFHTDAPQCYKVVGHLKSAKSCDASGLRTLPAWIS
jgi:hypothetical protein